MNVLFAPDTTDHPNWGCRVMGEWFRDRLLREWRPASVAVIPSGWFYKPDPELGGLQSLTDFHDRAKAVRAGRILKDVARLLGDSDIVLLNGENFIRPGALKGRMLLFLAYLAKVVFKRTCILTNHSVDLNDPALADIVRAVYPLLDGVHFREQTSWNLAAAMAGPGACKQIPDVAWALPAAPLAEWARLAKRPGHFSAWPDSALNFDPSRPYITVCASSIYGLPQHAHVNPIPVFARLCQRLYREVAPVLLTAPCLPEQAIMRPIHLRTGIPLLGNTLPVRQAIDVVGNAAAHIGGRWHLGIFATTGGAPIVALGANTHKMHSLMHQLDMDGPVFNALALDRSLDAVVAEVKRQLDQGESLRRRLRERARELCAEVELHWRHGVNGHLTPPQSRSASPH